MFGNKFKRKSMFLLAILVLAVLGANPVFAFGGLGKTVDNDCAAAGNPLKAEFMPQVENNCTACHDDGKGGSGGGKTAFKQGGQQIIDFFCPAATQPPTCTDADGDGFAAEGGSCGPMDPNDTNADVYPGAPEICTDGVDNDGNGLVDQMDPDAVNCPVACTDMDGDGYSTEGGSCGPMDCNDNDANINPGAEEICTDGIDNNCNGKTDSADPNAMACPVQCTDMDGDGYSTEGGSCGPIDSNDMDPTINPGAPEICDDGIDNNSDGKVDTADPACKVMDDDDKFEQMKREAKMKFEQCKAEYKEAMRKIKEMRKEHKESMKDDEHEEDDHHDDDHDDDADEHKHDKDKKKGKNKKKDKKRSKK